MYTDVSPHLTTFYQYKFAKAFSLEGPRFSFAIATHLPFQILGLESSVVGGSNKHLDSVSS